MAFFKKGAAALESVIEQHEAAEAAREAQKGKIRRFWLKAPGGKGFHKGENSADIIFLDDDVPVLSEHHIQIDGKWGNTFTCRLNLEGETVCPLCEMGDKPYTAAFYPIIDRTKYTSMAGTDKERQVTDQIRLLVAKPTTMKQLRIYQAKMKGLKGKEFNITRTDKTEPNVGNTFVPTETHKKAEIEAILRASGVLKADEDYASVALTDAKWEELLAPLSVEELENIIGKKKDEPSAEDSVDFT